MTLETVRIDRLYAGGENRWRRSGRWASRSAVTSKKVRGRIAGYRVFEQHRRLAFMPFTKLKLSGAELNRTSRIPVGTDPRTFA